MVTPMNQSQSGMPSSPMSSGGYQPGMMSPRAGQPPSHMGHHPSPLSHDSSPVRPHMMSPQHQQGPGGAPPPQGMQQHPMHMQPQQQQQVRQLLSYFCGE